MHYGNNKSAANAAATAAPNSQQMCKSHFVSSLQIFTGLSYLHKQKFNGSDTWLGIVDEFRFWYLANLSELIYKPIQLYPPIEVFFFCWFEGE